LTPLKISSKTDSRKSRPHLLLAAVLALLAVSAPRLPAQEVALAAAVREGIVCADIEFRWDREVELIQSLRDGLESRITFTARLYDRKQALLPIMRVVQIESRSFSQSAFFDFLGRKFIVETDLGRRITFLRAEDLIHAFFTMHDITLAERSQVQDPFVSVRVQFEPVRLMPPLTIISLVGAAGTYTSPWITGEVASP
jgi:hypothetical protein